VCEHNGESTGSINIIVHPDARAGEVQNGTLAQEVRTTVAQSRCYWSSFLSKWKGWRRHWLDQTLLHYRLELRVQFRHCLFVRRIVGQIIPLIRFSALQVADIALQKAFPSVMYARR
jgi:hypothetical protein